MTLVEEQELPSPWKLTNEFREASSSSSVTQRSGLRIGMSIKRILELNPIPFKVQLAPAGIVRVTEWTAVKFAPTTVGVDAPSVVVARFPAQVFEDGVMAR